MKMKLILACCNLALGLVPATASLAENTDYYKAAPFNRLKVLKVTVGTPSEKSELDTTEDCSTFVMTPARVQEFFNNARSVSEHQRMHELDWSACYAEGKVKFSSNETASWLIARHGVGALTFDTGARKGKTVYLHCARCEQWK
jgi:hypothetical protein